MAWSEAARAAAAAARRSIQGTVVRAAKTGTPVSTPDRLTVQDYKSGGTKTYSRDEIARGKKQKVLGR